MGQAVTWMERGFAVASVALLGVAGLLLFAVFAVAMRPLLIVAFVVASLGCLVLYYFSPAFRDWFEAVGERQLSFSGLRLATDVAVHPNHSWARTGPDGVVAGADDLVQATLGPVEAVELPLAGSRIEQSGRLLTLRRGDRSVEVRSPVSGTVVARNEALLSQPALVNQEPFADGWAVRLRPDAGQEDPQPLLRGKQARSWFRQEVDRLIATLLSEHAAAPSLADGGALVDGLYRQIDDAAWQRVQQRFFGIGPKT